MIVSLGNYIGQLRLYSYANLVLIFFWLKASPAQMLGASALWFGFLVHLEVVHKDRGRTRWHPSIWILLWIFGGAILWSPMVFFFYAASAGYALKKHRRFGPVSSLLNGLVKATLVLPLPGATLSNVALIFAVMTVRNLAGDFRDAHKDSEEHMLTVPVLLGVRRNIPYVYPVALMLSTVLWTAVGQLPPLWGLIAIVIQAATYNWTPR